MKQTWRRYSKSLSRRISRTSARKNFCWEERDAACLKLPAASINQPTPTAPIIYAADDGRATNAGAALLGGRCQMTPVDQRNTNASITAIYAALYRNVSAANKALSSPASTAWNCRARCYTSIL